MSAARGVPGTSGAAAARMRGVGPPRRLFTPASEAAGGGGGGGKGGRSSDPTVTSTPASAPPPRRLHQGQGHHHHHHHPHGLQRPRGRRAGAGVPGGSSRGGLGLGQDGRALQVWYQDQQQLLQRSGGFRASTHSLSQSQSQSQAGAEWLVRRSYRSPRSAHSLSGYRGSNRSLATNASQCSVGDVFAEYVDIDMAISNFHVDFDVSGGRYKPGDELSGNVIMDVWASIDIKHVEFHISGKGTLRMFQNASTFIERPKREVYLDKNIVLIGSSVSKRGVTLEPGRYVTNFQYIISEQVPPSVHQFDMGNGYVFDISYSVQARVCDFAYTRGPLGPKLRVVKSTRKSFTVIPLQDWHAIPGALEPMVHSDQLLLFCGAGKEPTTVIVTMDRGAYPVGGNIKLTTEIISPGKDVIKDITAELEQQLFFDSDLIKKFRRVILKAVDDGRNRRITRNGATLKSSFGISLPINIIPSYLPNCTMVDLQYTMKVKVRFKKFGGKLVIRIPVVIALACDTDRKDGELPLFNKPVMQFPYFSKSPLNGGGQANTANTQSSSTSDGSSRSSLHNSGVSRGRASTQDNVTTKYKTALNCCGCCLMCLGFGIIES